MACCLYFFQGSITWLALPVPTFAVFASFSSGHGALFIITITLLLSTFFLFKLISKQKPILVDNNSPLKESPPTRDENESSFSSQEKQENHTLISSLDCSSSCDDLLGEVASAHQAEIDPMAEEASFVIGSQDLYSESESMDQCSSCTSSEDDDDSISDEESLIEIAIPSGQFVVSPQKKDKDPCSRFNLSKCYKLSADQFSHQQEAIFHKDLILADMNEEDNLIEIDIYMGSIKCSSFDI